MKRLLLLLLLIGVSSACIDTATGIILSEQGTNIMLVIGVTASLITAAYVIGTAISNANYIVFAKDEAYHLGFSILLLLAFSGIVLFSCMFMDFFYGDMFSRLGASSCWLPGDGTATVSKCYMRMMKSDATRIANEYIKKHIDLLMDSTFSWNIQWPLLDSYTVTAGAYKRITSNQYNMLVNTFIVPILMSISMQKLLLDFVVENAVRWILPIAFLLRVFIPTRQMGNIMIAVCIALYLVVPFMYAFNATMYEVTLNDCTPFSATVCDFVVDGTSCTSACTNEYGFWRVARLIPQAFFLPNLTIAVVITFLACMNKALKVIG